MMVSPSKNPEVSEEIIFGRRCGVSHYENCVLNVLRRASWRRNTALIRWLPGL
jgi:hypothetical protein